MNTADKPTIEEVRAHAAAWMRKQDPEKNLPMRDTTEANPEVRYEMISACPRRYKKID